VPVAHWARSRQACRTGERVVGRAVLAGGSSGALRASWPPGPLQELAHCEPAWESALQAGPPLAFGPPGPLQELAHCEPAWEAALQAVTASQLEALLTATEERVDRLAFLIRCAPPPPPRPSPGTVVLSATSLPGCCSRFVGGWLRHDWLHQHRTAP